jgi:hypothetical protein
MGWRRQLSSRKMKCPPAWGTVWITRPVVVAVFAREQTLGMGMKPNTKFRLTARLLGFSGMEKMASVMFGQFIYATENDRGGVQSSHRTD